MRKVGNGSSPFLQEISIFIAISYLLFDSVDDLQWPLYLYLYLQQCSSHQELQWDLQKDLQEPCLSICTVSTPKLQDDDDEVLLKVTFN